MTATSRVTLTLQDIVNRLGGELVGPGNLAITQVATLDTAGPSDISFLASSQYRPQLAHTQAGAIVLAEDDRASTERPRIVTRQPYLYFARVSALLNPFTVARPGVHPAAVVHPGATVAASAQIDACAVVEDGATIGDRAVIASGSVIGQGASIGADSRIGPNVVVCDACVVGARCILHPGVVIGGDGFGMAEDGGKWVKVPQIGRVVLGDDVEIGANTTIDRGALGDTVIEEGVKMDNLIQIAHNVVVGAHTAIAACAGIAGSAKVGRQCKIGGAAMIHGHIEICDRAVVAAGTMVRRSITTPGLYDGFFPALPHREWMKNLAHFNRLHEHADTIRQLEARLEALERGQK